MKASSEGRSDVHGMQSLAATVFPEMAQVRVWVDSLMASVLSGQLLDTVLRRPPPISAVASSKAGGSDQALGTAI